MIKSIALKELHGNLLTSRFVIGFLLCLFLVPLSVIVGIDDYKGKIRDYELELKEAEESTEAYVYSGLRPLLVKKPEPLSIFSRGISGNVGRKVKI